MNTTTGRYYYWTENRRYGTAVVMFKKSEVVSPKRLALDKAIAKRGRKLRIIDRIRA